MSDVQTEDRLRDAPEPVVTEPQETAAAGTVADEAAGDQPLAGTDSVGPTVDGATDKSPAPSEASADPGPLESLRAAVIAGCERLNQTCQGADADFIRGQLQDLRLRVASVRPAELTPRSGLGGLFDSRKKRLARFRHHVTDLAPSISTAAVKLRDAAAELARRNGALNAHHQGLLDAITGLDEALMAFPERADPARDGGLKHLPLTRMVQNVDARLAEIAGQAAEAATGWRDDLLKALGADGKKLTPLRRVNPDQAALHQACEALLSAIDRAEAAVIAAGARRDEIMARMDRTLTAVRGDEQAA
ncbi:MAG: hypothetical protein ACK4FB_07765 [Brevundimonas sp.]|uniref:hypothetical protein n=1 Tax=Brevundimonas sp. TaxID=1871086 RepID=UPI00391B6781